MVRGGDSLSYRRERGQSRGLVSGFKFCRLYGSKVVIIEEDADVEGGVGVGETVARGGRRENGIDRWVVRVVFRANVGDLSLSKPRKSRDMNFF